MHVRLTHPPEFRLLPDVLESAHEHARRSGGSLELGESFDDGFRDADVVYPKSWGCMLTTPDLDESARIGQRYTDWIADERRLALAADDAMYLHCLPGGPRRRGHRRRHRRPQQRGLRRGREPLARAEGRARPDDVDGTARWGGSGSSSRSGATA
jgi:hypothetical protein